MEYRGTKLLVKRQLTLLKALRPRFTALLQTSCAARLACYCAAGIISLQMSAALSKADLAVSYIGFNVCCLLVITLMYPQRQ